MRRIFPLLLALLLSGCASFIPGQPAAPAPTAGPTAPPPSPTPFSLNAELSVDSGGYRLSYPAGWATRELSSTLTIAPSAADLGATSPGQALVVTIDATPLDLLAAQYGQAAAENPETFFEVSSGAAQQAGYAISATAPITVAGRPGLSADLSAPAGAGRLVVVITAERAVRVLGQAAPAAWAAQRDLFDAMLASLRFVSIAVAPSPTPLRLAEQPVLVDRGPPGFVLRIGGSVGPPASRFTSARGLAVAPDGTVYLAESGKGVWVFAPDGVLITTFGGDELLDAYDIARAPSGELFVADYGRNAVARFRPDGSFIGRWGSAGDAPDQFGLSAPQRIALGPDGTMYALDARPSSGGVTSSVVRFSSAGELIERIDLPADLAPADLAVAPDGAIFLADPFAGAVIKLAPDGREQLRFGDPASPIDAGAIDLDRQGNIYVATYTRGVLKLAPDGAVISQGASVAAPGSTPRPGELSLPNGIALAPGGLVWVSDNSGEYSALTALRLVPNPAAEATAASVATAIAPTGTAIPEANLLRQWAAEASASSFYAPDYDPAGAVGPPDVPACQDSPDAWASSDPNGLETLELRFKTPVFAVGVNVHQNHQPGFISQVELIDERGVARVVYSGEPALLAECPFVLRVGFDQTLTRIVAVRLTLDQRSGANWSEVDAVELVGLR